MSFKPILCLDFDGVLHSYISKWLAPEFIPDPPVKGAFQFLHEAIQHFDVQIYSMRSNEAAGIRAMRLWLEHWAKQELDNSDPDYRANAVINAIAYRAEAWPTKKPHAFVSLDDRVLTFTGTWPSMEFLKAFKPWNKK